MKLGTREIPLTNPAFIRPGTAIVTGASSGIGKVYADRLAARGYDLVLVARRGELLQEIAADLQERFSIRAEGLVADLSQEAGVAAVIDRLSSDETVSFLVNNAGVSTQRPLADTPDDMINAMIALNVTALTILSKAALVRFKERGSGTIVNIGSGAGFALFPGIPVYQSTKAYVYLLTRNLQSEAEGTPVRVQIVVPGAVKSEGWDRAIEAGGLGAIPDGILMTTENCVDAALAGLDQEERVTAPSLQDSSVLQDYEAAAGTLLQALFNEEPAARYGLAS